MFACSLPGFGPSEKSPQLYTTELWAAFIRDFVVNVVRSPVVVAGNSIGGGIPAFAAANHSHLFTGVVLVNTAGSIDDKPWDSANVPVKPTPNKFFVAVVSRCVSMNTADLADALFSSLVQFISLRLPQFFC